MEICLPHDPHFHDSISLFLEKGKLIIFMVFLHFSQSCELLKRLTSLKNAVAGFGESSLTHMLKIDGAGLIVIFLSTDNTYSFGVEGGFASAMMKMRNQSSKQVFYAF